MSQVVNITFNSATMQDTLHDNCRQRHELKKDPMLVYSPSDLFDFVATTGNVSGEGGEERTAMEDEDGERGTVGEETQDSITSHSDSCPTPVQSVIEGESVSPSTTNTK